MGPGQGGEQRGQAPGAFRRHRGVFQDEQALTAEDPHPDEERYVTIGMDAFARVLVVVYTWRGPDTIRVISARKATRTERTQYGRSEP